MKFITEEMKEHEQWYKEAKSITIETLPEFIRKLAEDYQHDYGTICHAITSAGIGAMTAIDNSKQGGITRFQAGCIMWEFIRNWNYSHNKCGLRVVNYDDMLYPQYDDKFDKVISKKTWKAIQDEANKNLEKKYSFTSENVINHWKRIQMGVVPFGYRVEES